jgi:hypothetical protein
LIYINQGRLDSDRIDRFNPGGIFMFHLHSAFAMQLLTVVAAAALLAWTGHAHVHAKKLVKAIAYAVIVVSVLSLLCTGYYGAKYSRAGHFETPTGMRHPMMPKGMMDGSMMDGSMMDGSMMDGSMMDGSMMGGSMMGGGMMKKDAMKDDGAGAESDTHSHDHDK